MKKSQIYTSGWLKSQALLDEGHADGITLTIKAISTAQMDDGTEQRSLSFKEDERQLGLNGTNWDTIAAITGKDDDDGWIGAVICVYPHKLDRPYKGFTHGIRVKAPANSAPRTGIASPNAAEDARKKAYMALKSTMEPDATPDALKAAWLAAVNKMYPQRPQITITAAEWMALEQSFSYGGEAAADDLSIPF